MRTLLLVLFAILGPSLHAQVPPFFSRIDGGGAVDLGSRVLLSAMVRSNTTMDGLTYRWRKDGVDLAGVTDFFLIIEAVTPADAGTYTAIATNAAGSASASTDLTVKAPAAPVITVSPRPAVASVGQSVSFGFIATGSYPRTHQWRKDGTAITGATDATLNLPAVGMGDAGAYSVVVANSEGSATSTSASLTVNPATPPEFSSSYPFDTIITAGQSLSLSSLIESGSSPITLQWRKDGIALPGATASSLRIERTSAADAGTYTVLATNIAGSATSRAAVVTIQPATPLAFTFAPRSETIFEGQPFTLSVAVSGSNPVTYQWFKNEVAITGVNSTSSSYSFGLVTPAHAGTYTLTATNAAGSITTSPIVITVVPAVPPAITRQPASQTVDYNGAIQLAVEATGSPSLRYLWKKDGIATGPAGTAATYTLRPATPTHNGSYTVEVTNPGGSVTSSAATVTVRPATLPTIIRQPVSVEVAPGLSTYLYIEVDAPPSSGQITFQWFRNGVPIDRATSGTYSITSVVGADAGDYSVVVGGPGGSITSNVARLTVLAAAPPRVRDWESGLEVSLSGSLGQPVSFGAGLPGGSPPFTYQWFKEGVAVSGATNSTFAIPRVGFSDFATYTLTITNEGGVLGSPPMRLKPSADVSTPLPWVDAAQLGDIAYFLASSPARIECYDLAAERWLPSVALGSTRAPTAFLPTAEGLYVAYGRALARRSSDFSTEMPLLSHTTDIDQLFVVGEWLYYGRTDAGFIGRVHRRTLAAAGDALNNRSLPRGVATLPGSARIYYRNTLGGVSAQSFLPDGSLAGPLSPSAFSSFSGPRRSFVFPHERLVADNQGAVFRATEGNYFGALGEPFDDLGFLSDTTPVALRANVLVAYRSDTLFERGRRDLRIIGRRIFTRGSSIFVFGDAPSPTAPFAVEKVALGAFSDTAPATAPAPTGRYSIDDVFLGDDGVLHLFSRSLQGFARWSATKLGYLPTVRLRGAPLFVVNQAGRNRVLLSYPGGVLTDVRLTSAPVERQIGAVHERPLALGDLDGFTIAHTKASESSGASQIVFGSDGAARYFNQSNDSSIFILWDSGRRRLFTQLAGFRQTLRYETVTAAGVPTATSGQPILQEMRAPLRLSPDGDLIVSANGRVASADLALVASLGDGVVDAAWLPTALYTLRNVSGATELQRCSRPNYLPSGTRSIRGTPVRIFALGNDKVVIVTSVLGAATFTIVNADLSLDTPPGAASLAGDYFGRLAGVAGDIALHVGPDRSAVCLIQLTGTRSALLAADFSINADGTFATAARELGSAAVTRAITGSISADGTVTGSVNTLSATFSATRSANGSSPAGFYQAPALNGGSGSAYTIIGSDGRALFVAQTANVAVGGAFTLDPSGKLEFTTTSGAKLSASFGSTGGLTATTDPGGVASTVTTFAGLRDGLPRTDRLANISTRGRAGPGNDAMIAGFVLSGTAPRPVLIRAVGPTLGSFGVPATLADPRLELYRGVTKLSENDNWSTAANAADLAATTVRIGGFALPLASADGALLITLDPGAYTAVVTAPADTSAGTALVEVYDAGSTPAPGASAPRLINIATRGRIGSADDTLIAGIVVTGNAPKRILVRAIGPGLAAFGVTGTLPDPVLTLTDPTTTGTLAANDDWSTPAANAATAFELAAAAVSTGAFTLPANSKDACLLVTLAPGNYTAQVLGKNGATGSALVEVYEVP